MDLGIGGKSALVCAASKGLGKACAMSLAREGVAVTIVARTPETLEATGEEIHAQTGAKVVTVAVDITTEEGQDAALAACPEPDILSTTPEDHRRATSATGTGRTGSAPSTPTC